jgi:short-subunit dehydrogenase involved in D-alanine esterification of teichoic acids
VSALTLIKLARAFEIEVYELLKPDAETSNTSKEEKNDDSKNLIDRFSKDLAVVLKESLEKGLDHVKKQYLD